MCREEFIIQELGHIIMELRGLMRCVAVPVQRPENREVDAVHLVCESEGWKSRNAAVQGPKMRLSCLRHKAHFLIHPLSVCSGPSC